MCVFLAPHPDLVVQLDEEVFALEAQFTYLGPAERVDLGVSLRDKKVKSKVKEQRAFHCRLDRNKTAFLSSFSLIKQ